MRSEETAKSISAAGVSEVSEAAGCIAALVSELTGKAVLLLFVWEFELVVEIPIGESGGQSPLEKNGILFFFAKGGRGHF